MKDIITSTKQTHDELAEITISQHFGKGKLASSLLTNNCVIYSRVSSKEQKEGYSLDIQLKESREFAIKNKYNVLGTFGGTYESAKTDERKEFNKMLQFCKRSKEKVTFIIIHMLDRFSRSGANAIYIKEQLKSNGIYLVSVRQPVDVMSINGDFQQNIQLLFSHHENQVRREKCVGGMKEAMKRGEWCNGTPTGYDSVKINGKRTLIVNATGKLLRKAFLWKVNEDIENEECRRRLKILGLNITSQRMSAIFKNPFYCGMIAHGLLEGKVVEGKHEKLVSKEIFLRVNEIQMKNSHGYKHALEQNNVPLKVFLKCDHCKHTMTGYVVKKKNIWYYKCRTIGCGNNKSAKDIHNAFKNLLSAFTLNSMYMPVLKEFLLAEIENQTKETRLMQEGLLTQKKELETKIERIEERYMDEEITHELYVKHTARYKAEILEIIKEIQKSGFGSSNPENQAEFFLEQSTKLNKTWASSDFRKRQLLQKTVFPDGLYYNKQNNAIRTARINSVFLWIARQQQELSQEKSGIPILNMDYPALVAPAGIEPTSKV